MNTKKIMSVVNLYKLKLDLRKETPDFSSFLPIQMLVREYTYFNILFIFNLSHIHIKPIILFRYKLILKYFKFNFYFITVHNHLKITKLK